METKVTRRGVAPSSAGEKRKERKVKETLVKRKVTVTRGAPGVAAKSEKDESKLLKIFLEFKFSL